MSLILWLIFGGIIGWIASMIMRTNDQQGIIANVVVGIVGALIGGFFAQAIGVEVTIGFSMLGLITALGGAVILLAVVKMFSSGSNR